MTSIKAALEEGERWLSSATASLDAAVLLAHVLGVDRSWLLAHDTDILSAAHLECYEHYVKLRAKHMPVAYIVGEKEFFALPFVVTPAVLVPRPDTEILVESVLEEIALLQPAYQSVHVVDVGTGSGCILLSVLHYTQGLQGHGSDVSAEALAVAQENAKGLGIEGVEWQQGSLLTPWEQAMTTWNGVVVITANLPYIDEGRRGELAPDILLHEPHGALFAPEEGSGLILELLVQAEQLHLRTGLPMVLHLEMAPYVLPRVMEQAPAGWEARSYTNLAEQRLFMRIGTVL